VNGIAWFFGENASIDGGITVITPNGNTGEFYALSQAEARQVVETAASAANNQAELLAGVGYDIATAVEAAGHARDHGARMIMIHQPVHPYVSREGWIDYYAAIASNAPDLGIVLYLRNERITGADIAALADRAPNVVGVKYGVRDAGTFAAVARDAGIDRFTWLAGAAELTAPAYWACGAHGFTSNAYVADPKEWAAVFHMPHDRPTGLWRMAFPVHPDEDEQPAKKPAKPTKKKTSPPPTSSAAAPAPAAGSAH